MKRITQANGLPPAAGPYSLAVINENTIYTAGQVGLNQAGTLVEGGIEAQTHQVMKNLQAILQAAGTDFNSVIKSTIYLANAQDFALVNKIYAEYFTEGNYPVRETTVVSLPMGAQIEISMIAKL